MEETKLLPQKSGYRYEFIDLMKGFCIILVVIQHLVGQCLINPPWMTSFRMPLYFMLSGLFFSNYGASFRIFLIKKFNTLLVPFGIMWLLAVSYIYWHYPNPARIDVIKFNVAIWFLIALFEVGVLYFFISLIPKEWIKMGVVLLLSVTGYLLHEFYITLPYYLDSSLSALIFYYLGTWIRKTDLLEDTGPKRDWICAGASLVVFLGFAFFYPDKVLDLRLNRINTPYPVYLLAAVAGTATIFFCCKRVKRIPLISYWGHYSIITLCTHIFIYRLLQNWGVLKAIKAWFHIDNQLWYQGKLGASIGVVLVFFITVPLIWVLIRHVPFLCSQMPLIDPKTLRLYKSPRTFLRIIVKGRRHGD